MSTKDIKVCSCDYCGKVLEESDARIHIFGNDDHWINIEYIKDDYVKNKVECYDLDFCNLDCVRLWVIQELL